MHLILMRHAKTEGANPRGDHARELIDRGRADAVLAGERLADLDVDYALVSTSARTRQTFEALGLDVPVEYLDAIYEQDVREIMQRIAEVPDDVHCLLVVGHSPSVPALAMELAREAGDEERSDELAHHFPTATYAVFEVGRSWQQLTDLGSFESVRLREVVRP
ncbi:SixA phosphatase family protein [Tessaracoccus oleiagri]|uniref:Phosphohistidine phosphatase n=1 Tax=Tessaracoccus oleiagri TaxID=686624 RepID=A0A1G9MY38_9ACTN|nr:histidine phosphatase family protein [Tessaracoccus oleiagri]SDL79192.1 phosphohistidine phosphatase [Tessaracoccus oleiagri]